MIRCSNGKEYDFIENLGEGSFGSVSRVRGISPQGAPQEYALKRFIRPREKDVEHEVNIMKQLHSPYIVQYVDAFRLIGEKETEYALVMEYVYQAPTTIFFDLTLRDVGHYMYQLLLALDTCHSQGIVHADIKPSNVALDPKKRELKIFDFGHSLRYHPDEKYTCYVGTVAYKAPELLFQW